MNSRQVLSLLKIPSGQIMTWKNFVDDLRTERIIKSSKSGLHLVEGAWKVTEDFTEVCI